MTRVYLSLGSNIDPTLHLVAGLDDLTSELGPLRLSPVYESRAVGFDGNNFLNLVVGFDSHRTVGELVALCHRIEAAHGRERGARKFASRTLDIDLLTYGDVVGEVDGVMLPRAEILHYAFVLKPLADLAGTELHPQLRKTYRALLGQADFSAQLLWQVPFHWRAS